MQLLAAYIWWSRRGRLARQSRQAALVEQMVAEGRLPIVITQVRDTPIDVKNKVDSIAWLWLHEFI